MPWTTGGQQTGPGVQRQVGERRVGSRDMGRKYTTRQVLLQGRRHCGRDTVQVDYGASTWKMPEGMCGSHLEVQAQEHTGSSGSYEGVGTSEWTPCQGRFDGQRRGDNSAS